MIVESLTTWIAANTFGFIVKTIISEDFLKDLLKDYAKDFFKDILKNAIKREPLQKAEIMCSSRNFSQQFQR